VPTKKTFCRFCHANCAIEAHVEDNRVVRITGDTADPIFGGYTCMKGREMPYQAQHPRRLQSAMKRAADGSHQPIANAAAFDEIAARLRGIIERHGPRAVASYNGTYAFQNSSALPVSLGFHKGLGSPSFYTSVTLDQPAKVYTWSRVGAWLGGMHGFEDADVLMMIGNNPLTSHYAPPGSLPPFSPSRRLRDAKARGLKLICIDPRATPTARLADIHLQVRPGEDPTLLAGMLRIILAENLHDRAFCDAHVGGLEALRASIDDFTPDYAARRAAVPADDLIAAARLFARGPRGVAASGTGPEMSPRGTLTEHLIQALNIVCGRFCREGEIAPVPRVLSAATPRLAQVLPPAPLWGGQFHKARVRGLTMLGEEMPAATLADEILLPGEGQIRALLCIGGNPVTAWPNQEKALRALKSLELLVCVDIKLSPTAALAHYVIAPQVSVERDDITTLSEWWYEEPYARYTEAIVKPEPAMINEWEFYWELAQRLGTPIRTAGGDLPLDRKPSTFEVLEKITHGCRVPLARIREETRDGGKVFPEAAVRVDPALPGAAGKFDLAPSGVPEELRRVRGETLDDVGRRLEGGWNYSHLLVSRRTRQFFNSTGHDLPALQAKGERNYAHMHPEDLLELELPEEAEIEICAPHASIHGFVKASPDVKRGVISMAHGFAAASTNRLVDDDTGFDPITGQCRQSAVPVRVKRRGEASTPLDAALIP